MMTSASKSAARAEAARILALFETAGAMPIEAEILQPAEVLLDLYGEDIRARAYVTADPLRGEQMLRPDFTVPVVRMHMDGGAIPARYAYAGEVFRKQETLENRPSESLQVGYELFDDTDSAAADAEVFTIIRKALRDVPVQAVMGDIGLLLAAVDGLETLPARKAALRRHIWRPRRFRALMDRYRGKATLSPARAALLQADDPVAQLGDIAGTRTHAEIAERIKTLRADAAAAPISAAQCDILDAVLSLRDAAPAAVSTLRDLAVDMPALGPAVDRLTARLDALTAGGEDVDALRFEGAFGRSSMEYYDGFVFAFQRTDLPVPQVVATGGRYDALTEVLGAGQGIPAVGGVIRPDLMGDL